MKRVWTQLRCITIYTAALEPACRRWLGAAQCRETPTGFRLGVETGNGPEQQRRELPALDETTRARWVDVDELYDAMLERMWPDHQRAAAAAID